MADDDKTDDKTDNSVDDKATDDKAGDKPETYNLKVGGEEKVLTLDELRELASKSAGADEKFRLASEMRDKGKDGLEIKEAFTSVFNAKDGNVDMKAVRKLARVMDMDAGELEKMFQDEIDKTDKKLDKKAPTPEKVGLKTMDEETRSIMEQARQDQIAAAEVRVEKMCIEGVDKDEFFGKMIDDTPDDQVEGRKAAILAMVQEEVKGKILASPYTKEKFGTEMITAAIQGVRARVKKFGISSKKAMQPMNLGVLGLRPTGQLPAEVHSDDEIKRVSSNDESYVDNVVSRLGQKMVQGIRNRSKG